jgi:hypothetical protein
MLEYKVRNAGLTFEQNFANTQGLLTAFSKWSPEEGLNVLAFVSKVSGAAGYTLAKPTMRESSNPS